MTIELNLDPIYLRNMSIIYLYQVKKISISKIAEIIGLSPASIRKILSKFEIPLIQHQEFLEKQKLTKLLRTKHIVYEREKNNKTFKEIGKLLKISSNRVMQLYYKQNQIERLGSYATEETNLPNEKQANVPIDDLDISYRIINSLKCENIFTLSDLCSLNINDLEKIPNLGYISLQEIVFALKKINLGLITRPNSNNLI